MGASDDWGRRVCTSSVTFVAGTPLISIDMKLWLCRQVANARIGAETHTSVKRNPLT